MLQSRGAKKYLAIAVRITKIVAALLPTSPAWSLRPIDPKTQMENIYVELQRCSRIASRFGVCILHQRHPRPDYRRSKTVPLWANQLLRGLSTQRCRWANCSLESEVSGPGGFHRRRSQDIL